MIAKITTAIFTSILAGVVLQTSPTQAATVEYDFTIDLFSGESFDGMFSFDDSTLTGIGFEALSPLENEANIQVDLSIFDQNITEADDVDFDEGFFPAINFFNGELVGLDLLAPVEIDEPGFGGILVRNDVFSFITDEYFTLLGPGSFPTGNFEDIRGTVSYQLSTTDSTTTPEPASILGFITLSFASIGSIKNKLVDTNKA